MLTLQELGIPDITKSQWKSFSLKEKLNTWFAVWDGEKGSLATDLNSAYLSLLIFPRYCGSSMTWQEVYDKIVLQEGDESKIARKLHPLSGSHLAPYFTNNFMAWFPDHRYRTLDFDKQELIPRLDSLMGQYQFVAPQDYASWEGQKAIFPFYIAL